VHHVTWNKIDAASHRYIVSLRHCSSGGAAFWSSGTTEYLHQVFRVKDSMEPSTNETLEPFTYNIERSLANNVHGVLSK
jgi:hypothetical protein